MNEPQARPARQPLFQPKAKPLVTKQFKGPNHQQQSAPALASEYDDWEALSQAGSSTRWRSSNTSLADRPFHHICPLSESTLLNGYESESPDEVTLVRTACKYGCKLLQRGTDFVIIWLPGKGVIGAWCSTLCLMWYNSYCRILKTPHSSLFVLSLLFVSPQIRRHLVTIIPSTTL